MTTSRFNSSRPPDCVLPRPHTDENHRRRAYGKVQPMDEASRDRDSFSCAFCWFAAGLFVTIGLYHLVRWLEPAKWWFQ